MCPQIKSRNCVEQPYSTTLQRQIPLADSPASQLSPSEEAALCTPGPPAPQNLGAPTRPWIATGRTGSDQQGAGFGAVGLVQRGRAWPSSHPSTLSAGRATLPHPVATSAGARSPTETAADRPWSRTTRKPTAKVGRFD